MLEEKRHVALDAQIANGSHPLRLALAATASAFAATDHPSKSVRSRADL
jgi:hypothetical protein